MTLPTDQQRVRAFVEQHRMRAGTSARLLDLSSELGELAKEYLKRSNYGSKDFVPGESWREEMGDLYFALICLAEETNVDLGDALARVLEKYEWRIENKDDAGSGSDSL